MELMSRLICEKEVRLCSRRYQIQGRGHQFPPGPRPHRHGRQDFTSRSVYPHDGEDIKAHRWFRDIPWDHLQRIPPPFVPQIASQEDTHYFDEEEPISDWSESLPDTDTEVDNDSGTLLLDNMASNLDSMSQNAPGMVVVPMGTMAPFPMQRSLKFRNSSQKIAEMHARLAPFPQPIRDFMYQFVATPYDSMRLKRIHRELEQMLLSQSETERLKEFVRNYGKKERKRPRDRLLRDRQTKGVVMEIRKRSAFLGYTWTRMKARESQMKILGVLETEGDRVASGHLAVGVNDGSNIAACSTRYGGQIGFGLSSGDIVGLD
jgi:protein-serine/threonine kinase